jgi:hypothetical protein
LHNTGEPVVGDDLLSFLPHIFSIYFGTERRLQLCWILVIFYRYSFRFISIPNPILCASVTK